MRFLHLADLLLGKSVDGFSLIDDQKFALRQILSRIEREAAATPKLDAVLIAGDFYDKPQPSAEAVGLADWFLTELAKTQVKCFIIPGNHDSAERLSYANGILSDAGIHIAGSFMGSIDHFSLADEHGPVTFWLLPFVKPVNVRVFFPDDEIGTDYTAAIKTMLQHEDIDYAKRNVALVHQFVSFGSQKPETSDSELASVGGLDEVDSSIFDQFDYVALGHIHKSQPLGKKNMRYAGSLLKYSFSEAGQEKRFPLITLGEKGRMGIEFVEIQALHDMREIKGPLADLVSEDVVNAAPADDYLHITLTDENPIIDALARVRAVYPNMMELDYQTTLDRMNAQRDIAMQPEKRNLSPSQLFEEFFEERLGRPLSPLQRSTFQRVLESCMEDGDAK